MVYRILIAGAGQLGSRYLQGLARLDLPVNIWVFDPSEAALKIAEARWIEVSTSSNSHYVKFIRNLEVIPRNVDLTIVATSADVRSKVVSEISKKTFSKYWVLEKVLGQSEQDLDEMYECLLRYKTAAWVNTHFRTIDYLKKIKDDFIDHKPTSIKVHGGNWGLACNAIHYLDLFSWMSGSSLVSVKTDGLDNLWVEAKRLGFYEIFGLLEAEFSYGGAAFLECTNSDDPILVTISSGQITWVIDESRQIAKRVDGSEISAFMPFQSGRTADLVRSILINSTAPLPTFQESSLLHAPFLKGLLSHWNENMENFKVRVPIT